MVRVLSLLKLIRARDRFRIDQKHEIVSSELEVIVVNIAGRHRGKCYIESVEECISLGFKTER